MKKFYIKNIHIDDDSYKINEYISLKKSLIKNEETVVEIDDSKDLWENNIILFFRALQISMTRIHIDTYANEKEDGVTYDLINELSSVMINYYSTKDNPLDIFTHKIKITEKDVSKIIKAFNLGIEYNKKQREERENNSWKPTRWTYAYNQYINACQSMSIEISILNIITGLESLLVKGQGELTYKVSLYSSILIGNTMEERKSIYNLVKWMYNLRSKVVHGEIKEVVKNLSNESLYDKYFDIKDLFSKILIRTYNIEEETLFFKIEDMIFSCPQFKL